MPFIPFERQAMPIHDDIFEVLAYLLNEPEQTADAKLYQALRLLCKYRSQFIANTLIHHGGNQVRSGPFRGLILPDVSSEGCYIPKLLGTYELGLQPIIANLAERGYDHVIDIGCAEGYYAVGLACALPNATVQAYDTDPNARALCADVAEANGVRDRVHIGEKFTQADFDRYVRNRVFVICDIEGGEAELFDPDRAPALRMMDMLIETHDVLVPGCTKLITNRFRASHSIQPIPFKSSTIPDIDELQPFEHLDRLLAIWEWRLAGNDWLWLQASPRAFSN
jgi:hypothetical protein